jgi:predicted acyltransferase
MIFGLMAGELLQSSLPARSKMRKLCLAGVGLSLAGLALVWTGICPLNKLIWTPSFALYSGGWCVLLLGWFYYVVDVLKFQRWTYPAVVLGANSIAVYIALGVWSWSIGNNLHRHFTWWVPASWADLASVLRNLAAALIFWLVFFWMYRRKIFLRI